MIDRNVAAVVEKHAIRASVGVEKYGVTTERTDLSPAQWLLHLQEELMDGAVYVQRLIRDDAKSAASFWVEQAAWSRKTFGEDHERGPTGPLKHLAKEVQEALADPTDVIEFADLLFLVFDATRRAGFTFDDLLDAAWKKLEVNESRTWQKPTSDEPVEHVR